MLTIEKIIYLIQKWENNNKYIINKKNFEELKKYNWQYYISNSWKMKVLENLYKYFKIKKWIKKIRTF